MIIVTNKIKTKKGFAEKIAPRFTQPGPIQQMEGFVKVEVTIVDNLEEYDLLNVNMYWENMDSFHAWKNSDVFEQAHKQSKEASEQEKKESPMLGSEIVIAKVASVIEAT